jgi:hypothetical protein
MLSQTPRRPMTIWYLTSLDRHVYNGGPLAHSESLDDVLVPRFVCANVVRNEGNRSTRRALVLHCAELERMESWQAM